MEPGIDSDTDNAELHGYLVELKQQLERANLSHADLLHVAACMILKSILTEVAYDNAVALLDKQDRSLDTEIDWLTRLTQFLGRVGRVPDLVTDAFFEGVVIQKRTQAKTAADMLHSRPGGSRDKQRQIQKIWRTGKYKSRDICAEQECAGLEMSFSAARKALRNIPDPHT